MPSDDRIWTWRPSGRTKWPPGSCHWQDEREPVGVWADECTQHPTHWPFLSFFSSVNGMGSHLAAFIGTTLGYPWYAVIDTAQQQDAGRFGALGRVRGKAVPERI